jgi:GDPmannose 4,6-dehydratase
VSHTHLITGVAGQDGILLARRLLAEGGRVVGTVRPGSSRQRAMAPYLSGVALVELDLRDVDRFARLVDELRPDEVYNLAAISSVGRSWERPEETVSVNGEAAAAVVATLDRYPELRFLQAASVEETAGAVDSPYARGKRLAREAVVAARERGRFACAAVLHPHESVLRPLHFVSRKVTAGAAAIALGRADALALGRLDVSRDWGAAADHVAGMRMILQADEPADFVVGTGTAHSLRDLVEVAFAAAGIEDPWARVRTDPDLARPVDAVRAHHVEDPPAQRLGWAPTQSFEDVIGTMVRIDIERLASGVEERESYLSDARTDAR